MITRYSHRDLLWIDVESPTKDDVLALAEGFSLHPLISEEMLSPTPRPKVDTHDNSIFLVLHFPAFRHSHKNDVRQEVDFIIGKKFLVTVRYDGIDAIHKFSKEFEVNSILNKHEIGDHAGFLFFYLVKKLYHSLEHELEHIEIRLKKVESRIFKGDEYEMVAVLSRINRDLLDFKQALRTHKEVLKSLETVGGKFFGGDFSYYLEGITGEFLKIVASLEGHKETLLDLRETNDSLLANKTTAVMKTLTMISFTTFPLMVIVALFSMKTVSTPIVGMPFDFWIISGIIVITMLSIVSYFKYKKWL